MATKCLYSKMRMDLGFCTVFSTETIKQLPTAEARQTKDIAPCAPCSACAIRHAAQYSGVSQDDFSSLVTNSTSVALHRNQTLFTEGDPAEQLYSIRHGTVMVYKMTPDGRRQITGFLSDGDILGLASKGRYVRSAEAITDVSLFRYPVGVLEEVLRRYPAVEQRICEITRHELIESQEQMLLLGRKTARERVASFLLKLNRHASERGGHDDVAFIPMTRNMIGDYLGIATETVSRILTEFDREGLIALLNVQEIRLVDVAELEAIANGNAP